MVQTHTLRVLVYDLAFSVMCEPRNNNIRELNSILKLIFNN